MSRFIICDICDTPQEINEPIMVISIPSEWISPYAEGDPATIDVCTLSCMQTTLEMLTNGSFGQELPAHDPVTNQPVTGESPDQGDDEEETHYAPEEPVHVDTGFLSPVIVKTKGER